MTENDQFIDRGNHDVWDEAAAKAEPMIVDLDGYEGPLDVLLELARGQKVDLAGISILQLAEQYLAFIGELRRLKLEIAADYLVMGAWLAYLKSRLLLPDEDDEEEPSGEEMAAALAFRLRRLESMREAGANIFRQPQIGREFFTRGAPERFSVVSNTVHEVSLYELLSAYADQRKREIGGSLAITPSDLFSVDDALKRLRDTLGRIPDWQILNSFLPPGYYDGVAGRSAVASVFAASLELTRAGVAQIRQDGPFGPIYVRARKDGEKGRD